MNEHLLLQQDHNQQQQRHNQKQESYFERAEKKDDDKQRARCHNALKTSYYESFKNLNPEAAPNTCRWVLEHPRYLEWRLSSDNNLLWISADPGCGKSVLSRLLVDTRFEEINTTKPNPEQVHSVCHFFFKDLQNQNKLSLALSAILHQLFTQQPDLIRHALPVYQRNNQFSQETIELWRILEAVASDPKARSTICVLDALDECRDADLQQLIDKLCAYHRSSVDTGHSRSLKWIVTSRPYDDIQWGFSKIPSSLPSVRLRDEDKGEQIRQEIDSVIRHRINQIAQEFELTQLRATQLEEQLLGMKNRTYLWLHLAIDEIRRVFSGSLQPHAEEIVSLPVSVEDAYERILGRVVDEKEKKLARMILTIIVGARRPLTVEEMGLALGTSVATKVHGQLKDMHFGASLEGRIRRWCGLFVYISQNRLYLLHQTAKEFLLSHSDQDAGLSNSWRHCLRPIEVERDLAVICVRFLCVSDFDRSGRIWKSFGSGLFISYEESFFEFAAGNWAAHARGTEELLDMTTQEAMNVLYDPSRNAFKNWVEFMWQASNYPLRILRMSPVQLAAYNGHNRMLERLLAFSSTKRMTYLSPRTPGKGLDERDGARKTALMWASSKGYLDTALLLLEHGASVNLKDDELFGSALQQASIRGHAGVVRLLLGKGAIINQQGGKRSTALHAALHNGNNEVARILLDAGANANSPGGLYGSPLNAAAMNGNKDAVLMLLDAGAHIDAVGKHDWGEGVSALMMAASYGHEDVVRLLLNAGADVNTRTTRGNTALKEAVIDARVRIVRVLLDAGADVNLTGPGGTALHAAASKGDWRIIPMLLDAGAKVNIKDGRYRTALQMAVHGGRRLAVHMLLEAGADVHVHGGLFGTAMTAVYQTEYDYIVDLLRQYGARDI